MIYASLETAKKYPYLVAFNLGAWGILLMLLNDFAAASGKRAPWPFVAAMTDVWRNVALSRVGAAVQVVIILLAIVALLEIGTRILQGIVDAEYRDTTVRSRD